MAHSGLGSHDHDIETGLVEMPGGVRRPPAPGEEVAGPPLTSLVAELRHVAEGMEALYRQARAEAAMREYQGVANDQTDSNGDALLSLFQVPQGATGYLTSLVLDMAGVTPATPDTNANLWHAIYGAPAGSTEPTAVIAVGQMLDCTPTAPTVDAQIPYSYVYGSPKTAPKLVGPATFYCVIDGATAARQVAGRYNVLVVQPEP